ncbi:MAG: hypothetical protein SFZ02_21020 [bacterium]|nr:hypothetical protein [bacterium]
MPLRDINGQLMIIRRKFSYILPLLIILLGAFALRMMALNVESVWHDEAWSIRAMRAPFITPDDKTPFLYYFTGHMLQLAGVGNSPLALRYVSVLYGVLTVAVGMWMGWRWFGIKLGLFFGILLAISPLLWEYSQEVRAYSAVPLWTLGLLACADAISRHKKNSHIPYRLMGVIMALEIGVLYTHNLGVPLVVWVNVALGMIWLVRWDIRGMMRWAVAQIGVIIAYLPWMLTQAPSGTALNTPPMPSFSLMRDIWHGYFLPVLPQLREATNTTLLDGLGIWVLVGSFFAVGISVFYPLPPAPSPQGREGEKTYRRGYKSPLSMQWGGDLGVGILRLWLIISQVSLLPLFSTALFIVASIDFHPRYYIASLPATLLCLLIGTQIIVRLINRHMATIAIGMITLMAVFISSGSIQQIMTTRAYQHDDFAGLANYYAQLPEDAVILIPFDVERALQDYYADVAPIRAKFVTIPIYSDEGTAVDVINQLVADGTTHIEFLTWYQVPADVRGMYPCLLTVASDVVGEQQFFYGLSTQTYVLSQPIVFSPLALSPKYTYFELIDAQFATSSRGTCVKTAWTLKTPFEEDLAVATALSTPFGERIADDDASIARDDSAGTSRWNSDDVGTAYTLLHLPEGAPMTNYALHLAVYSPAFPSGFDILDGAGNPMGVETRLEGAILTDGGAFTSPPPAPSLVSDDMTAQTGIPFTITLVIPANRDETHIQLIGDSYTLDSFAPPTDKPVLAWAQFIIPPNSGDGVAQVVVDGTEIAQYTITDTPRIFTQPSAEIALDTHFIGVGTLVGADVPQTVTAGQAFPIRLIWQADSQASPIAYTVFVQLLDENGRVLAQSDAQPVNWTRPTTSWIDGEYLDDVHTLNFGVSDFVGMGKIIVGFYDANDNFRRVMTIDGGDFAELPVQVNVVMP